MHLDGRVHIATAFPNIFCSTDDSEVFGETGFFQNSISTQRSATGVPALVAFAGQL